MTKEERNRALREFATEQLFSWLTQEEQATDVEMSLGIGAGGILAGKVRLVKSTRIPEGAEATTSDGLLGLTAVRLARSFGEDAPGHVYPEGTWAGSVGYVMGLLVDYVALADRLLRKFVPEYVPSEAAGASGDGDGATE